MKKITLNATVLNTALILAVTLGLAVLPSLVLASNDHGTGGAHYVDPVMWWQYLRQYWPF